MAGPGGGPPRKSHTKSRKGCRTCKRRHIRCDEKFPQCRNCTKHSSRCDYMDMPAAGEEPVKGSKPPDLLMSDELQQVMDSWRLTGQSPLSELQVNDPSYWMKFSTIDLRLIHHITTLSLDLHSRGYSSCTPWAPKILNLIHIALSSDFAMSALLALSASHLAWQTKNQDTENLAFHHRGVALKGLHEAIGSFSESNSEAVLAASMLLSWQATEWRSWASLQQGVSTVVNSMRQWLHKSELANYLEAQRSMAQARTPSTTTISGHPSPLPQEDLHRVEQMSNELQKLRLRLANHDELVSHVDWLISYLSHLREDFPLQAPEEAFVRLQPLREALFWLPPTILHTHDSDLGGLAMLTNFFALALVLEPLFPEIGGAYLGNMCVYPIENMYEMLRLRRQNMPQDTSIQVALSLCEFPNHFAAVYKSQHRPMMAMSDAYHRSPQSPYSLPLSHMRSSGDSTAPLYGTSPMDRPRGLNLHTTSYFSPPSAPLSTTSSLSQRESSGLRSPLERTISVSTPLSHMSSYSHSTQDHGDWKPRIIQSNGPTPENATVDYFGMAQNFTPSHLPLSPGVHTSPVTTPHTQSQMYAGGSFAPVHPHNQSRTSGYTAFHARTLPSNSTVPPHEYNYAFVPLHAHEPDDDPRAQPNISKNSNDDDTHSHQDGHADPYGRGGFGTT